MKTMRLLLRADWWPSFYDLFLQGRGEGAWPLGTPWIPELHCSSLLMTSLVPSSKSLQYLTCVLYLYFYRPHKTLDNNGEISIGWEKK